MAVKALDAAGAYIEIFMGSISLIILILMIMDETQISILMSNTSELIGFIAVLLISILSVVGGGIASYKKWWGHFLPLFSSIIGLIIYFAISSSFGIFILIIAINVLIGSTVGLIFSDKEGLDDW
ncbi:MAG: hypothetical protein ACTSVE_02535 [Candidatus Helarchaeota archaeon]